MSDEGEREGGNIKKKNQKVTIGNDSLMSYSVSVMMKSQTGFFIFPSTLASSHIYDNVGGFFLIFSPPFIFSFHRTWTTKEYICALETLDELLDRSSMYSIYHLPCHSFGLRYQFRSIPVYIPNCFADHFAQSMEWRRRRIPASPFLSIAQFQLQNYFAPLIWC